MTINTEQLQHQLDALLDRVANGEEVTIMRGGHEVARLVPAGRGRTSRLPMTVEEMRAFRKGNNLGPDLTIKQLIEEGRRH